MCAGQGDGNTLMAANSAIAVLLVILFLVLGSFLSFIFFLAKRAKQFAAEENGPT